MFSPLRPAHTWRVDPFHHKHDAIVTWASATSENTPSRTFVNNGNNEGRNPTDSGIGRYRSSTVRPVSLLPGPHRIAVIALLVHVVFDDGGNRVEAAQRLRLGLGGTTN